MNCPWSWLRQSSLDFCEQSLCAWVKQPAKVLFLAVLLQVTLGALTVWSRLQPVIASAHVIGGALVLASSLVLALRVSRV